MKNHFIFSLLMILSFSAFAQQDTTIVYSIPGYENDPVRANWKKTVKRTDSSWIVSLFDKKDRLQEQISYADQTLEVRKGPYVFYGNGILEEKGQYGKGHKVGNWKYYFNNGQVREQANYTWGKLNGNYNTYWKNGNAKSEGKYALNIRVGNWKMFYADKKVALTEEYNDQGKLMDGVYFDESGKSVRASDIRSLPSYPGGFAALYEFLAKEIRYPADAQKNKTEGTVNVAFTVLQDGSLADVKVMQSPDDELSTEAIRVLKSAKRWMPAKELGEAVDGEFIIPVRFNLRK